MRRTPLLALVLLAAPACTLPFDHSLSARSDPVRIWGYTASPNREITVSCNPVKGYPFLDDFVPFETIYSSNQALTQAGETAYEFDETIVIPNWCWAENAAEELPYITFINTQDAATGIVHDHFYTVGFDCLVEEYFSGEGPITTWQTCRDGLGSAPWAGVHVYQ